MRVDPSARALQRYRERLAGLAGMKGQRNASLLGLVNLGVMAGLPDDRLESEIVAASGTPPLTVGEIRHALRTARRDVVPLTDRPQSGRWTPPPPKPPPLGSKAASFVPRHIERGRGATFDTLAACSPVPVPTDPKEQATLFLETLYNPHEFLFIGKQTAPGVIGVTIRTAAEWRAALATAEPPPHVILNPLTGAEGMTKDGKPSYRCAACIATYRYALVEFDDMPLAEQCAFWAGVIDARTLPLRSLTFSGGKSIHALVEIDAANPAAWERAIDKLLYAVCHPCARREYQSDRACRNPDRLPRLPGALRLDKGTRQTLLWLSREAAQGSPVVAPSPPPAVAPPERSSPSRPKPEPDAARCRDCWNWQPTGGKHGCRAGIGKRVTPDWRGPCPGFDPVL